MDTRVADLKRLLETYKTIDDFPRNKCRLVSEDAATRLELQVVRGWWIGPITAMQPPPNTEHYWLFDTKKRIHYDITPQQFDPRMPEILSLREPTDQVIQLRTAPTPRALLRAGIYDTPPVNPSRIVYHGVELYRWTLEDMQEPRTLRKRAS